MVVLSVDQINNFKLYPRFIETQGRENGMQLHRYFNILLLCLPCICVETENYGYNENESCEPVILWIDLFLWFP